MVNTLAVMIVMMMVVAMVMKPTLVAVNSGDDKEVVDNVGGGDVGGGGISDVSWVEEKVKSNYPSLKTNTNIGGERRRKPDLEKQNRQKEGTLALSTKFLIS